MLIVLRDVNGNIFEKNFLCIKKGLDNLKLKYNFCIKVIKL